MLEYCLQNIKNAECVAVVRLAVTDNKQNALIAAKYKLGLSVGDPFLNDYLQILTQIAKHQQLEIPDIY